MKKFNLLCHLPRLNHFKMSYTGHDGLIEIVEHLSPLSKVISLSLVNEENSPLESSNSDGSTQLKLD